VDDLWWKRGIIYQIYPRSFMDSNADGIGDLEGVIEKLDYLNDGTPDSLGVDAIWFSPTFPSPMKDFGYDVSDYTDVHPDFGNLATMDRLIEEAHKRGIRVVLDFVPNHSSDKHPWFVESRSSRESPKRDWYVWRDAKPDGSPPNNWIAAFGGPAWEWDQKTQQYYLHSFLVEQPDLNWRNPDVEQAMHDVLRFWMRRGIDGFRIDVMDRIIKDEHLRDNPPETNERFRVLAQTMMQRHIYDRDWPDTFDAVKRIRKVVDEYPERMTVGEVFGPPENIVRYYGGEAANGLHMAFNFPLVRIFTDRWRADHVRSRVDQFEAALPRSCWPNYVLGNHDVDRVASRLNDDGMGQARARVAALLLLTLRGTPFIYYGDEIGMENVDVPEEQLQDPARFYAHGRDPERTPMQWTESGGFTRGARTWLPYGDLRTNVEDQLATRDSLLSLYRRITWFRRSSKALTHGDYEAVDGVPEGIFAYTRSHGDERLLVVLSFMPQPMRFELPEGLTPVETIAGTHGEPAASPQMDLAANEGRLLRLS
jgi:alpha-glucosidase